MLNICACLSNQARHQMAYQKACICLEKLGDYRNMVNVMEMGHLIDDNFWMSLQITYYNMAVELEHLQQYEHALRCYEQAQKVG
jgi:tetratricopeptide (TPR) repeat protein